MENEKRMYTKPMYKCAVCGKIHETIPARIQCETDCYHRQELEAKKAEEAKKKEEQEARHKEVVEAYDRFNELLDKYAGDYGTFVVNGIEVPTFGKLMDHFLF